MLFVFVGGSCRISVICSCRGFVSFLLFVFVGDRVAFVLLVFVKGSCRISVIVVGGPCRFCVICIPRGSLRFCFICI